MQSEKKLNLLSPNEFVMQWVKENYEEKISNYLKKIKPDIILIIKVGNPEKKEDTKKKEKYHYQSNINKTFTFNNFIEGKSNQLARAAGIQVGENPGKSYNPMFIYGGVGLGKTHLMQAIGNIIQEKNPHTKVRYMHSERFVADMVRALQHGLIDEFKQSVREVNALLIDDVQFFAGKERSQEEFFHTFNALFESHQQIILTSDCFPKEVKGLEDRLKSRFGSGLTVAIEPPDLETRMAILMSKATRLCKTELPDEVALFIAKNIQSNVRELEGALRRISANAQFTGQPITISFAKEALRDMLDAQARLVTLENIKKTVSEYFKIRTSELISNKRSRTIVRPRQIAMLLSKELTNHSLPEIGESFGGRDHTTVLYATRRIKELYDKDHKITEDYKNLLRILSN